VVYLKIIPAAYVPATVALGYEIQKGKYCSQITLGIGNLRL
jgi:hypothetical protein